MDGTVHPVFALALFEGLPEGSMTAAQIEDVEHWRILVGVTRQDYQLAAIYDALNMNTRATGNFKKPPTFDPYPTPDIRLKEIRKKEERKKEGLNGLFKRMTGGMNVPTIGDLNGGD